VATCFLGLRGFISIGLRVADENYLISVDFHVGRWKIILIFISRLRPTEIR